MPLVNKTSLSILYSFIFLKAEIVLIDAEEGKIVLKKGGKSKEE